MDEGDGTRVSTSEVEDGNGDTSMESQDVNPRTPFAKDAGFSSSTPSRSLKMLLKYNSINGDCVEKVVNRPETSLVASASNNSMYSELPDVTNDSLPEDTSRLESDSDSESSKSSGSESESHLNFSYSKPVNSPLHHSESESSSDSDDLSDSDADNDPSEGAVESIRRVDTPDTHSSQSFQHGRLASSPMEVDELEKQHESESQSDESSRKEDNTRAAIIIPEKSNEFDVSQSSDESSIDSVKTSSISQDVSLPQVNTTPSVSYEDVPSALREKSNALNINYDASSLPGDSSSSSEVDDNSEENAVLEENSKTKNRLGVFHEVTKVSTPLVETGTPATSKDAISEENNTSESHDNSDLAKYVDSIDNKSSILSCSPDNRSSLLEKKDLNVTKPDEINSMSSTLTMSGPRVDEGSGLSLSLSEISIVKQCTTSCFPKIENVSLISSDLHETTENNEENEICKLAKTFSIKYKGFKKIGNVTHPQTYRKQFLRWNPFNPARKKDPRTGKYILMQNISDDQDASSLQPEYAQYLGLQPIIKFKCSYCGISNFQSMSALNTHKIECKKTVLHPQPPSLEKNRAITIRRRVYMCSVCGSYKPRSEVFQHMLEIHKLYICLFDKCLKFCNSPDALLLHFQQEHRVEPKHCPSLEEFQKEIPSNFYLLCVNCKKVFTESDDPANHICPLNTQPKIDLPSTNDPDRLYTPLHRVALPNKHDTNLSQSWDISKVTASIKLNKDITMKPVSEMKYSDMNKFRNPTNIQEIHNNVLPENVSNKYGIEAEIIPNVTDNLNIKVPSDIEIKPLIPGEIYNQENNYEPTNGSAIEIFPIPQTQPQKSTRKIRTVIKKTIRKKKVIVGKKKKAVENMLLSDEILGSSKDSTPPPISPPIIAPPPVVRSPEPEPGLETIPEENDLPLESVSVSKPSMEEMCPSSEKAVQEEKPVSPERPEFNLVPLRLSEHSDMLEIKRSLPKDIFKIKLQGEMDTDGESDDSQKLSLVVDENTNNSEDSRKEDEPMESNENDSLSLPENTKNDPNEVPLASEDVAAMALTLDDKIENVPIQAVVKECVRTSCMSCNYCRHAVKIAVNGKQLALHLLSEHRYTPVKNETNDDVIRKLKNSLETLDTMYFNAETYDSSDPSIHVPYDKDSNFDCFQCSYVSSSHKDLLTHKRKYHAKSLLLCIMCKKNFISYSELICHICAGTYCANPQVYSVDINFRCCFCRLDTLPSAFRLMVHLRKSHHTCDICLEICTEQQKLSTHMWKHKLSHLCYRCGIAYASKPDITKHLFWKHGTESVLCKKCLQKKWPHVYHFCIPPTSFICEECNTSFSKAVALKVHKRIHGNDYPYSCPQCEKKFVSKKLLSRHIDRHNAVVLKKDMTNKSPDDNKDEIINVTDVDNKDDNNENSDSNKEGDSKDKSHKKHKKEKDKKDKKVVDVYDLPPLNLSSESDSSDEDAPQKSLSKDPTDLGIIKACDTNTMNLLLSDNDKGPDMPKLDGMLEGDIKSLEANSFLNFLKQDESVDELTKGKPSESISPFDSSVVNSLLPMEKDEMKGDPMDLQNDHIDGIWENFYKTNPQNSNLPFPLCAMKSELAYSIIMGDHDYCQVDPSTLKVDLPSTSDLNAHLSDDKLEEIIPLIPEPPKTPPPPTTIKEVENPSTPSKKKLKSPKKKATKAPDDKNSSSSSDSSTDSDSSCSCATNCSCSSSSDSSSSSSSDSDSSTNEDKKDKRRKKKDKKVPPKPEKESEEVKETPLVEEDEIIRIAEPVDPPIRESELETDESTSDEEFYDRQPQIIANQMIAEKREKLNKTEAPVNNGSASPLPSTPIPQLVTPTPPPTPLEPLIAQLPPTPLLNERIVPSELPLPISLTTTPKAKLKTKRKRRVATPRTSKLDKILPEPVYPKYSNEPKSSPFSLFQQSPPVAKQKHSTPILGRSPSFLDAGGSGSETDNMRLSKRRRVPNKFYGYSSGEEDEKQPPKWRKADMPLHTHHTPKLSPVITNPPPTPRIQLSVPKPIIRRPYHKQASRQKIQHHPASSDSTDSGSDIDDHRVNRPSPPQDHPKAEKDVYCYCRCPYDEVSEMIACDDSNCKIEWFHFECVDILVPPRGQWFCPDCRKARGLLT